MILRSPRSFSQKGTRRSEGFSHSKKEHSTVKSGLPANPLMENWKTKTGLHPNQAFSFTMCMCMEQGVPCAGGTGSYDTIWRWCWELNWVPSRAIYALNCWALSSALQSPYFLRQDLSLNSELMISVYTASQWASESASRTGLTDVHHCDQCAGFGACGQFSGLSQASSLH